MTENRFQMLRENAFILNCANWKFRKDFQLKAFSKIAAMILAEILASQKSSERRSTRREA